MTLLTLAQTAWILVAGAAGLILVAAAVAAAAGHNRPPRRLVALGGHVIPARRPRPTLTLRHGFSVRQAADPVAGDIPTPLRSVEGDAAALGAAQGACSTST